MEQPPIPRRGGILRAIRDRGFLPEGAPAVGIGLVVAGVTAYAFLIVSARALGAQRYAAITSLWALTFMLAPGVFFPVEQEVARALAARAAHGLGGRPVVRRAGTAVAVLAAALLVATFAAWSVLLDRLFDDQALVLLGFGLALVGYAAQHLVRGALAGDGRFGRYAVVLTSEGVARLVIVVALFAAGVASAGPYALAFGVAPLLSVIAGVRSSGMTALPGPATGWSELSRSLGWLIGGALLAQALANAPPLAVKLLATESEQAVAGRFLAALIVARVPLFLFAAVQASALPKLAALIAAGRWNDFDASLRRLVGVVAAVGVATTIGAAVAGPWIVRVLFGRSFVLGRSDLLYLAAANAAYMLALTLVQPLIALSGHARALLAWLAGLAAFAVVATIDTTLLPRIERAFLVGSIAALAAIIALVVRGRARFAQAGGFTSPVDMAIEP